MTLTFSRERTGVGLGILGSQLSVSGYCAVRDETPPKPARDYMIRLLCSAKMEIPNEEV